MKIDTLIGKLIILQKLYPDAVVYFTDETSSETHETYFEDFYVDDEDKKIEMKFVADKD